MAVEPMYGPIGVPEKNDPFVRVSMPVGPPAFDMTSRVNFTPIPVG
jgi:hypothetical protein